MSNLSEEQTKDIVQQVLDAGAFRYESLLAGITSLIVSKVWTKAYTQGKQDTLEDLKKIIDRGYY